MSLLPPSEIREVSGISPEESEKIQDFLQGAIYAWCKNQKGKWFALRDLMGGDNFDWNGTALQVLFYKHENLGKTDEDAIRAAAKDCGWLLKKAIHTDERVFETKTENLTRKYRWVQS